MKKYLALLFAAVLLLQTVIMSTASVLSPGLAVLSEEEQMTVSGLGGTPVKFTPEQFCRAAGITDYDSLTVVSLPPEEEGKLYYNNTAVQVNQVISRENTERLSFIPSEGVKESTFRFTFDRAYSMSCTVKVLDEVNFAPSAYEGKTALEALPGIACSGQMVACDPEGDRLIYEITESPRLGNIDYEKDTGRFTYTPSTQGKDSFGFTVRDTFGNYSEEARIDFNVSAGASRLTFADMNGNGAYAAAVILSEKGLMTYSDCDGELFFEPDAQVTRLDFLVTAMNALGASNIPSVKASGFADDAEIPEEYKGYVYSARKLGIINGVAENEQLYFKPSRIITKGEAAVILNNIIGHSTSSAFSFSDEVPDWASEAVCAMYDLGVYTQPEGKADVSASLTKADEAQLLARLRSLVF